MHTIKIVPNGANAYDVLINGASYRPLRSLGLEEARRKAADVRDSFAQNKERAVIDDQTDRVSRRPARKRDDAEASPNFGPRLRRLRQARRLTLQQVADAIGCTKAYVWEMEMRPGQKPSAERVWALARTLGVSMEELMGGKPIDGKPLSAEDRAFIDAYLALPSESKARVRAMLQLMFDQD